MEDPKSSFDNYYRKKAFGTAAEGGMAPNGFCYACGGTEHLLVLERLDIVASGTPTVSPLCRECKDRGIDFRARKSTQTNLGKGAVSKSSTKWEPGMLCMARCKVKVGKTMKTLLYPAMITSCSEREDCEGPYSVWYFDGDKADDVPLSALDDFVSVRHLVYAKCNGNNENYFPAEVTKINFPEVTVTGVSILPKVTLDLTFTDDGYVRKRCPLSQVYRPLKTSFGLGKSESNTMRLDKRGTKRKRD
jgi:hypothetical protein